MPSTDLQAFGSEIRADEEDALSPSFDAGVRGFTGLLVGLVTGMATWGLIIMIWWLV